MSISYLRPQCQVLLLQVLQLSLEKLQLAEGCGGGGSPKWQRLPQRRGHAGVGLALLGGAGHYPQQLVLLTELMLQLVNLVDGEDCFKGALYMFIYVGNYTNSEIFSFFFNLFSEGKTVHRTLFEARKVAGSRFVCTT